MRHHTTKGIPTVSQEGKRAFRYYQARVIDTYQTSDGEVWQCQLLVSQYRIVCLSDRSVAYIPIGKRTASVNVWRALVDAFKLNDPRIVRVMTFNIGRDN